MIRRDLLTRLEADLSIDDGTGCWTWTGGQNSGGYGQI